MIGLISYKTDPNQSDSSRSAKSLSALQMRNHMNCSNPWTVLSSFSLVSRTLTITSTHSLCLCRICKQHVFQFDDYVAFAATLYVIQHRRAFVTLSIYTTSVAHVPNHHHRHFGQFTEISLGRPPSRLETIRKWR